MRNINSSGSLGSRAVVVGGGMGGLMAAEVLAHYFAEVVILEKDVLPKEPISRMGAPQGSHVHALLVQGRRNLERLFPGFTDTLKARGAVSSISGLEFRVHDGGGWHPRRNTELMLLTMSRPLLEGVVREATLANPHVTLREDVRAGGWCFTDGVVAGVSVDSGEIVAADLVVDASGRSGNSVAWLEEGGYGPVEETSLEIGTGYASAFFKKPANWKGDIHSMVIRTVGDDSRGGIILSVENDRWLASLLGRFDQQPSGDPEKFMAFAKSLCVPDFYEWVSQGEQITPIKVYKAPVSRWRHYERLPAFPQRLLPVGDALAHVNPIFGQGMTLASAHVMELWEVLEQRATTAANIDNLAIDYFPRVNRFTGTVWSGLETVEFGFPTTKGVRPPDIDARMAYSRALRDLIVDDPEIHRLMIGVGQLVYPPEALQRPDIVSRVRERMQVNAGHAHNSH